MSLLCTLKNCHLSYGPKIIFNNAELSISFGDRIGLLGLNGKGKSTLFKVISGEVNPDSSTPPFEFTKKRGDIDKSFSYFHVPQELPLFKDAKGHFKKLVAKDYFFEFNPDLKNLYENSQDQFEEQGGWTQFLEFESYLKLFGLLDLDVPVENLSGGEQKKILLSLGLTSKANLILWDEPTNHLDLPTIELFESEMQNFHRAFILISHDRYLLSKLTNKIFHLENGKIKNFSGSYTDYLQYLEESEHAKSKLLDKLKNNLERETAWMRQGVKARGTRSKKRVENFEDLRSKVTQIKMEAKKSLDLNLQNSKRQTKVLISTTGLNFHYHKGHELFNNLNLEIKKGDKIGLLGKNGAGKSTLLKLFTGEIHAQKGIVKMADELKVLYCSQKREELNPNTTPYDLLGDGNDFIAMPDGSKRHVISYFESFLFHRDDIKRPLKTFSGGEKSRLQLALNLTRPCDILIFDEPTNDLDLETIDILEKNLAEFQGALIIISHDRAFLANVTNKVWYLDKCKIENFEGGYDQVAPYLEALEIEEDLLNEEPKTEKSADPKSQQKPKANSLVNKSLIDAKYEELSALESKLKIIDDKIAQFDFSKLNDPKNQEMKILTDAQNFLQDKIAKLYHEIENLES